MWPLKKKGENTNLYHTCSYMCNTLKVLGIGVDGGKDSLSMSVTTNKGEIIKAPSTLVISGYVGTNDVTKSSDPVMATPSV